MPDVVVVGAGGHAREVADIVRAVGAFRFVGFLADAEPAPSDPAAPDYLGPLDNLTDHAQHYALAIGDSQARARVAARLTELGGTPISAVHPSAHVGPAVTHDDGLIVFPGACLTTNVRLGRHCHVNVNSSISHDCRIGDFVTVSPGSVVCGAVEIGDRTYVGANACIIQNLTLGADVTVGAGAVVSSSLLAPGTYVGVPARISPA